MLKQETYKFRNTLFFAAFKQISECFQQQKSNRSPYWLEVNRALCHHNHQESLLMNYSSKVFIKTRLLMYSGVERFGKACRRLKLHYLGRARRTDFKAATRVITNMPLSTQLQFVYSLKCSVWKRITIVNQIHSDH